MKEFDHNQPDYFAGYISRAPKKYENGPSRIGYFFKMYDLHKTSMIFKQKEIKLPLETPEHLLAKVQEYCPIIVKGEQDTNDKINTYRGRARTKTIYTIVADEIIFPADFLSDFEREF